MAIQANSGGVGISFRFRKLIAETVCSSDTDRYFFVPRSLDRGSGARESFVKYMSDSGDWLWRGRFKSLAPD
jgi:hypothetical protein